MASDSFERIDRLLTRAERHIAAVFGAMIEAIRDELDLSALADLIEAGRWLDAFELIERTAARLGAASNLMFIQSAQDTATFMATAGIANIAFDQVNVRAVAIMQQNRLRLIREFTEGQRNVLRAVMTDGIARGLNPRDQARQFREVVGLTDRQARAVINYRRLLTQAGRPEYAEADQLESLSRALRDRRHDRSVMSAVRNERPLTAAQIETMVDRYRRRYIKYRAEVIARTEALRSVHEGVAEAFDQAIDAGDIEASQIEQKWVSARDGRVRDSHRFLNGQKRPLGGVWQGLNGVLRYPGDPNAPASETVQCRCVVTRRIVRAKSDPLLI
jgi:hypothetical protein